MFMYLNKKIKILERKKSILLDYVTAPGTNGFSSFGSDVWPAIAKIFINMYKQGDSKKKCDKCRLQFETNFSFE